MDDIENAIHTVDENSGREIKAAEIVEEDKPKDGFVFDASSYANIKALIQSHLDKLDQAKEKLNEFKTMLDDALLNSPTYQELVKKSEETTKERNKAKTELLKNQELAGIVEKVNEFRLEVKESRAAISEYLVQYQQIAGVNEIEDKNGDTREIVLSARIK